MESLNRIGEMVNELWRNRGRDVYTTSPFRKSVCWPWFLWLLPEHAHRSRVVVLAVPVCCNTSTFGSQKVVTCLRLLVNIVEKTCVSQCPSSQCPLTWSLVSELDILVCEALFKNTWELAQWLSTGCESYKTAHMYFLMLGPLCPGRFHPVGPPHLSVLSVALLFLWG